MSETRLLKLSTNIRKHVQPGTQSAIDMHLRHKMDRYRYSEGVKQILIPKELRSVPWYRLLLMFALW